MIVNPFDQMKPFPLEHILKYMQCSICIVTKENIEWCIGSQWLDSNLLDFPPINFQVIRQFLLGPYQNSSNSYKAGNVLVNAPRGIHGTVVALWTTGQLWMYSFGVRKPKKIHRFDQSAIEHWSFIHSEYSTSISIWSTSTDMYTTIHTVHTNTQTPCTTIHRHTHHNHSKTEHNATIHTSTQADIKWPNKPGYIGRMCVSFYSSANVAHNKDIVRYIKCNFETKSGVNLHWQFNGNHLSFYFTVCSWQFIQSYVPLTN